LAIPLCTVGSEMECVCEREKERQKE
jgi:hypothetical protein